MDEGKMYVELKQTNPTRCFACDEVIRIFGLVEIDLEKSEIIHTSTEGMDKKYRVDLETKILYFTTETHQCEPREGKKE